MSMTMQMTVVQPDTYTLREEGPRDEQGLEPARGEITVWEPHAVIELHSAKPDLNGEYPRGTHRAQYCALSFVFGKLLNVPPTWNRSMFAPPFAMPEDTNRDVLYRASEQWFYERRYTLKNRSSILFPWHGPWKGVVPDLETRRNHNKLVSLSRRDFRRWRREHERYRPGPFTAGVVWHPCSRVSLWLRELEKSDNHHGKVLNEDPEALAIVKSWRSSLMHLGQINYRVIFTFDYHARMRTPFF